MLYSVDYDGVKIKISRECSENLEKVCYGLAKNATGDWRNNHLHITIKEENGIIKTSVYGLGKVNRFNSIPFKDILSEKERKESAFYSALYGLILGLNEVGIVPDYLRMKVDCGEITSFSAD